MSNGNPNDADSVRRIRLRCDESVVVGPTATAHLGSSAAGWYRSLPNGIVNDLAVLTVADHRFGAKPTLVGGKAVFSFVVHSCTNCRAGLLPLVLPTYAAWAHRPVDEEDIGVIHCAVAAVIVCQQRAHGSEEVGEVSRGTVAMAVRSFPTWYESERRSVFPTRYEPEAG
jgi:hypothetical protein